MDKNPQILEAVHEDLQQYAEGAAGKAALGGRSGRKPVYASENLFRAVIVRIIVREMEPATASFCFASTGNGL